MVSSTLFGQKGSQLKFSSHYTQGFIIPEFDLLDRLDESIYQGAEISLFRNAHQKNYWQQLYNHPEYGVSLFYTRFGEDQVLGSSFGAEYFFKISLINQPNFKIYLRSGFGLNYINKKYDPLDNALNTAMGSNYNVRFNLRFPVSFRLADRLFLNMGIGLDHFSNANTQYPNRGINAINFYGGMTYHLVQESTDFDVFKIPELENRFQSIVSLYMGLLHTKWPNNTYYPVPTISYDLNYKVGRIFNVAFGGDVFYDSSVQDRYVEANSFSAGLHLAQTINYNKFSFSIQEGIYLYSDELLNKNMLYNRVVFNWMLSKKIGLSVSTLSYLSDLELVAIGARFNIY